MAAYRQLLAENHVEEILLDVKQNKNLDRKKELPVWLPLAALAEGAGRETHRGVSYRLFCRECRRGYPHLGLAYTRTFY